MTVAIAESVAVATEVVSVAEISVEFPEDWTLLDGTVGSWAVEDIMVLVMLNELSRCQQAYRNFLAYVRTWEAGAYENIRRDWQWSRRLASAS